MDDMEPAQISSLMPGIPPSRCGPPSWMEAPSRHSELPLMPRTARATSGAFMAERNFYPQANAIRCSHRRRHPPQRLTQAAQQSPGSQHADLTGKASPGQRPVHTSGRSRGRHRGRRGTSAARSPGLGTRCAARCSRCCRCCRCRVVHRVLPGGLFFLVRDRRTAGQPRTAGRDPHLTVGEREHPVRFSAVRPRPRPAVARVVAVSFVGPDVEQVGDSVGVGERVGRV